MSLKARIRKLEKEMEVADVLFDCAPDIDEKEHFDTRSENCYRRGFHHGVVAAIEAMIEGFTEQEMQAWERRVRAWRSKKHNGKPTFPEWLGRKEVK